MRARALVVVAVLMGCSTETYGLGGEVDLSIDGAVDTSFVGGDTEPLFDADDDTSELPADSGADSLVTIDSGVDLDTGVVVVDSAVVVDSGIDTGVVVDSGVISDSGAPPDTAPDTAPDTGLVPAPGQVACNESGTVRLCAAGQVCCRNVSLGGVRWSCESSCGALDADYKCDEKADCMGGQHCCAEITPVIGGWNGSACGSSCDETICMSNADCPSGKACSPTHPHDALHTIGRCQ